MQVSNTHKVFTCSLGGAESTKVPLLWYQVEIINNYPQNLQAYLQKTQGKSNFTVLSQMAIKMEDYNIYLDCCNGEAKIIIEAIDAVMNSKRMAIINSVFMNSKTFMALKTNYSKYCECNASAVMKLFVDQMKKLNFVQEDAKFLEQLLDLNTFQRTLIDVSIGRAVDAETSDLHYIILDLLR